MVCSNSNKDVELYEEIAAHATLVAQQQWWCPTHSHGMTHAHCSSITLDSQRMVCK
jgi:hypothetical protein